MECILHDLNETCCFVVKYHGYKVKYAALYCGVQREWGFSQLKAMLQLFILEVVDWNMMNRK